MLSSLKHNLCLHNFSICARSCVVLSYRCLLLCLMLSRSFLLCQVVLICLADTAVDDGSIDLFSFWQPTYTEKLVANLLKIHSVDHCKGTTFFKQVKDRHGNATRYICKMFTFLSRKSRCPESRILSLLGLVLEAQLI
jgi:hypothetical protein